MSAAPDWMVQHMQKHRQRCSTEQCNAIPTAWKTEFSNTDLPHGPEVSYGIPFRWSASRLLASDMRSVLCSAMKTADPSSGARYYHNDSAECDALLNLSAWTVDNFIKSYADNTFHTLLKNVDGSSTTQIVPPSLLEVHEQMMGFTEQTSTTFYTKPDEESLLWNGPEAPAWVACNQRNKTCYGKIFKHVWYESMSKRAEACVNVFSEQVRKGLVNSTAVGLDICNLNSKTNEMCQSLKAAQVNNKHTSANF